MSSILSYAQIVISVLLITSVLLQQSAGSIGVLGGGSDDTIKNTRRGSEKFLLQAAITLGVLLAGTSILALFV